MAEVKQTRLRFISTKNAGDLVSFLERLPFKVEIKGGPVPMDGRWFLFFVIPDNVKDFVSAAID